MAWNIITDVPKVNVVVAICQLVVNIFLPGVGTALTPCFDFTHDKAKKTQVLIGLIQVLCWFETSWLGELLAWICAMVSSCLIIKKSGCCACLYVPDS